MKSQYHLLFALLMLGLLLAPETLWHVIGESGVNSSDLSSQWLQPIGFASANQALLISEDTYQNNNLAQNNLITLPNFQWPWDSSDNGEVLWTSGPHSWSRGGYLTARVSNGRANGLDFARSNSPRGPAFEVISMASGIVIKNECGFAGLGCIVAIRHDVGSTVMIYAHLEPNISNTRPLNGISEGSWYPVGEPLGRAGRSGGQTNVHLHIELRDGSSTCFAPPTSIDGNDCGDVSFAGNPVGWDGRKLVDGYYINAYFDSDDFCGPGADCDTIFNYDGSAIKGSIGGPFHSFPYRDCSSPGNCIDRKVLAFVHPDFIEQNICNSTISCEINAAGTVFADKGLFSGGGGLLYSTNQSTDSSDNVPPSGSWSSPSNGAIFTSNTLSLGVNANDNFGGSGVREVRFSAKWSGVWSGIGNDSSVPYSLNWDWCAAGVPNGEVELGLEVWDNANNVWIYSQHFPNIRVTKSAGCGGSSDTTPPSASWTTPLNGSTVSGNALTLNTNASDNAGGSGVREVRFSAKWNNQWRGVGADSTAPYSINWDWCAAGVPNGEVELGLEVWDNANNVWIYSQHFPNIRVTKSGSCGGGGTGNWTVRYYDTVDRWWDTNNSGNFRCEQSVTGPGLNRSYGSGAPCSGMDGDTWVGDYTATINFSSANYVLRVEHDDAMKLWINGQNIVDRGSSGATYVCPARFLSGNQNVRAILREDGGDATIRVSWTTDTSQCSEYVEFCTSDNAGSGCYRAETSGVIAPMVVQGVNLNDQTRSVRVPNGRSVMVFYAGDLSSTANCYSSNRVPLPSGNPNNLLAQVSSAQVFSSPNCPTSELQTVMMYASTNYGGHHWGVGRIDGSRNMESLELGNETFDGGQPMFNDQAESLRIPDGWSVQVYAGANQVSEGRATPCLTGDVTDLNANGWNLNNQISSVEIFTTNSTCTRPDTTPPTGRMLIPVRDTTTNAVNVVLRAEAMDNAGGSGINQVMYYGWSTASWSNQQWKWLGTSTTPPFDIAWDASAISDSGVFILAEIYDRAGNKYTTWGDGLWTVVVIDRTAPTSSVRTLPAVSPITFTVDWAGSDSSSSIAGYDIEYQDNGSGWILWQSNVSTQSAAFTGVAGHSYAFRSRVRDSAGNWESWPTSPDAFTTVEVQIPRAPGITSPPRETVFEPGEYFTVTWETTIGSLEYNANFYTNGGIQGNSNWRNENSYEIALVHGGYYFWRVKARNSAGESDWGPTHVIIVRPGMPSSLIATGISRTQINLTWTAASDWAANLDGYRIYRDGVVLTTTNANATAFSDVNLSCGRTHTYTVRTYVAGVESVASNTATASTSPCAPDQPTLLLPRQDAELNTQTVDFTWQAPGIATGLDLRISSSTDANIGPWLVDATLASTVSSYRYSFSNDGVYYWHLRSINGNSSSAWVSRRLQVDILQPIVNITSHTTDSYLSTNSTVIVVTNTDGGSGPSEVQFFAYYAIELLEVATDAEWHYLGTDTDGSNGWRLNWNTGEIPDQNVALFAYGFDRAGNYAGTGAYNIWLDRVQPNSAVELLPAISSTTFTINWGGSDAGAGVSGYDIQYQIDGGSWQAWQDNVMILSATFSGQSNRTYAFRSRARDYAGNLESWPTTADTVTFIAQLPPTPTPQPTSAPNAAPIRNRFTIQTPTLSWIGITGALQYEVQIDTEPSFAAPQSYTSLISGEIVQVTISPLPEGTFFWRVRVQHSNGIWSEWSMIDSFAIDLP